MLDDVSPPAHAHKLRVMGSLDVGSGDARESLQNQVAREGGIPSLGHQPRALDAVHNLFQMHRTGHIASGQRIGFLELREQDLAIAPAVAVVRDPNHPVPILDAVGIRHAVALIQKQTALPCCAFIPRNLRGQVVAAFEIHMVDEQQVPRGQAADEKTRTRTRDGARPAVCPSPSFVCGMALPKRAAAGADEHPETPVLEFNDHVLERPGPRFHGTVEFPSPACVGGNADPVEGGFLLVVVAGGPCADGFLCERDRHQPFARRQHRDLVHAKRKRRLIADSKLRAEQRRGCIGLLADAGPDVVLSSVFVAAVEEVPEAASRIDPHSRVVAPGPVLRFPHGLRRRERFRAVVAPGQQDGVFRCRFLGASGEPRDKHASMGGAFKPGDSLPCAVGDEFLGIDIAAYGLGKPEKEAGEDQIRGESVVHRGPIWGALGG